MRVFQSTDEDASPISGHAVHAGRQGTRCSQQEAAVSEGEAMIDLVSAWIPMHSGTTKEIHTITIREVDGVTEIEHFRLTGLDCPITVSVEKPKRKKKKKRKVKP